MRKALAVGLMALICCLAIYFVANGCSSERSTETQSTVISLRDVQFEYGSELLARDSTRGYYVEVYRAFQRMDVDSLAGGPSFVVAMYTDEDSVAVVLVDSEGNLQAVNKPFKTSSYTNCLMRGCAVCDQYYVSGTPEHGECVGRVMVQCAVWDWMFGWLCS